MSPVEDAVGDCGSLLMTTPFLHQPLQPSRGLRERNLMDVLIGFRNTRELVLDDLLLSEQCKNTSKSLT